MLFDSWSKNMRMHFNFSKLIRDFVNADNLSTRRIELGILIETIKHFPPIQQCIHNNSAYSDIVYSIPQELLKYKSQNSPYRLHFNSIQWNDMIIPLPAFPSQHTTHSFDFNRLYESYKFIPSGHFELYVASNCNFINTLIQEYKHEIDEYEAVNGGTIFRMQLEDIANAIQSFLHWVCIAQQKICFELNQHHKRVTKNRRLFAMSNFGDKATTNYFVCYKSKRNRVNKTVYKTVHLIVCQGWNVATKKWNFPQRAIEIDNCKYGLHIL